MKQVNQTPNKVGIYTAVGVVVLVGFFFFLGSKINVTSERNRNIQSAPPTPQENMADPLYPKFKLLSANGNSSCSSNFSDSIPSMPDAQRLQGSCCSPMVFSKYKDQVAGLKKYSDVVEIPSDPYDIPASLAKQLLEYDKTITPTADEQITLDKAVADSPEKGYCCCKCWRWYVYEGLSKYLVREKHFTSGQITDILANSDGCGGST